MCGLLTYSRAITRIDRQGNGNEANVYGPSRNDGGYQQGHAHWWAEYDILMANYRAMFADNICHNPDMLNTSLLIIEAKIEKVPFSLIKCQIQI